MKNDKKLYSKADDLRFRKEPDTSNDKNILKELKAGQEMVFVDGPWVKVRIGKQEGWVHMDYVAEARPVVSHTFKIGVPSLAGDAITLHVRTEIGDEYRGGRSRWELQCTEYVTYRVKTKLGVTIQWPVKSGRNGGKWAEMFETHKKYKILSEPKVNCAMSFTDGISADPKVNAIGHVAFVEEVNHDGSIKISEANWPRNGMYNERVLSKEKWKDQYKGRFIEFI